MRIKAKIDDNQNKVVSALRRIPNVSVRITSMLGKGFVDIVVGYKGQNYLIEIKDGDKSPSRRKLTPDEEEFHSNWKGSIHVANSVDDILDIIGVTSNNLNGMATDNSRA